MTAVYRRELRSYFSSMIGYVFIAVVVFFIGIYFMANNLFYGDPRFSLTLTNVMVVFLVAIPVLTMKSMAEERRSPPTSSCSPRRCPFTAVVLGKHLAMVTVLAVPWRSPLPLPPDYRRQRRGLPGLGLRHHPGLLPHGVRLRGGGALHLRPYGEPDHRRRGYVRGAAGALPVDALMSFLPDALANVLGQFSFGSVLNNFAGATMSSTWAAWCSTSPGGTVRIPDRTGAAQAPLGVKGVAEMKRHPRLRQGGWLAATTAVVIAIGDGEPHCGGAAHPYEGVRPIRQSALYRLGRLKGVPGGGWMRTWRSSCWRSLPPWTGGSPNSWTTTRPSLTA